MEGSSGMPYSSGGADAQAKNNGSSALGGDPEKSRSRSRVGVTTGQIAIGTPSYSFKSKMNINQLGGGLVNKTGSSSVGPAGQSSTLNIINQKSLADSTGANDGEPSQLSQRGNALLNTDSMKENLNNVDFGSASHHRRTNDYHSNGQGAATLTLKEQTNQDIDKLFGIKFDSQTDSVHGQNQKSKFHNSPQIGKPAGLEGLKKMDFLNSSIGSIKKQDSNSNAASNAYRQRSTLDQAFDNNSHSRQRSLPARTSQDQPSTVDMMNNSGINFKRRAAADNRIGMDDFSSYKSRQDQRNAATLGGNPVKDYRASSFQLNVIHEEDQQHLGGNSGQAGQQILRMGAAGSSILNNKSGLDSYSIKPQGNGSADRGTSPTGGATNAVSSPSKNPSVPISEDLFSTENATKHSSAAYRTSSLTAKGKEESAVYGSALKQEDIESSYGLTSITKPTQIQPSPSQQEMSTNLTQYGSMQTQQQRQQSSHTRAPGQNSVLGKHKSPIPFFAAQNVLGSSGASLRTPFRQSYQEPFSHSKNQLGGGGGSSQTNNHGSTMSIRSGGIAAPSSLLEDKRNLNFGGGSMERSQKILDQSSQEVLDYLGAYESSIEVNLQSKAAAPPVGKRDRSEPRRDDSI